MKRLFMWFKASLRSKLYRITYCFALAFISNAIVPQGTAWVLIPIVFLIYPVFMGIKMIIYAIWNVLCGR